MGTRNISGCLGRLRSTIFPRSVANLALQQLLRLLHIRMGRDPYIFPIHLWVSLDSYQNFPVTDLKPPIHTLVCSGQEEVPISPTAEKLSDFIPKNPGEKSSFSREVCPTRGVLRSSVRSEVRSPPLLSSCFVEPTTGLRNLIVLSQSVGRMRWYWDHSNSPGGFK